MLNHSLAVSSLHKSLRKGDADMASYMAAWLLRYEKGRYAAWRRILSFPSEDMAGRGVEHVAACWLSWKEGRADEAIFEAIRHECEVVAQNDYRLIQDADELHCAAIYWSQSGKKKLPVEAYSGGSIRPGFEYLKGHARVATYIWERLNEGDVEMAALAAVSMLDDRYGKYAAWRPVLQFPAVALGGKLMAFTQACRTCWEGCYEGDHLFAAMLAQVRLLQSGVVGDADPGQTAVKLMRRAVYRVETNERVVPPPEAYDMHTGHGTLADFWEYAHKLGPGSIWREDATKMQMPERSKDRRSAGPVSKEPKQTRLL